jgi:hypothetical protein
MTIVQVEDTRNVEWRSNNKGSALLQKMGWTEGKGIGRRNANTTALRAVKRQAGLGLGAKMETEGGQSESANTFAAVLKNLQGHHGVEEKKKKPNKKKQKGLILPQNKVTAGHAQKMRQAKFGEKSADDLACIFGNKDAVMTMPAIAAVAAPVSETSSDVGSVPEKKKKKDKKKKKRDSEAVQEDEGVGERKKRRKLNKAERRSSKDKKYKSKES